MFAGLLQPVGSSQTETGLMGLNLRLHVPAADECNGCFAAVCMSRISIRASGTT